MTCFKNHTIFIRIEREMKNCMKQFDELRFSSQEQEKTKQNFLQHIAQYDESISSSMRSKGYRCKNQAERTVAFTFGEVTFSRKRWYKNGECRIPVDEMLGLEKNVRHSQELLYQAAVLATKLLYRQVGETIEMVYNVTVTKDTVNKVVKLANQLLEEKDDYRFFKEEKKIEKIKADIIYIEGDGVYVKTSEDGSEKKNMDLSHFVVHTGSKQIGPNRFELENKKELIRLDNRSARRELLDLLENEYEITNETVLVTNSDCGKGYTPHVFTEIAKSFNVMRHEHFWDEYHLNKEIKEFTKSYPIELREDLFQAIKDHNKKLLRRTLDTIESLVGSEEGEEKFEYYSSRLMRNFQYTKPAEMRGLQKAGIGIMESQHRKITYRMKHRGMYWTSEGGIAVANMILLEREGKLRDLFFGEWKEIYDKYTSLDHISADSVRPKNESKDYQLPRLHESIEKIFKMK